MNTALIIGSGPAAAGAALALSQRGDLQITMLDVGVRLERERQDLVDVLASSKPNEWDQALVRSVSEQPVDTTQHGVPEKRVFGSDYPFRNVGQLDGLTAADNSTTSLISAAYGGFSNVWGSQLMPFTASTFDAWPVGADAMRAHYETVLNHIPFAGEDDDLSELFPLLGRSAPLPPLSQRSQWVLDAYSGTARFFAGAESPLGKARLAFDAANCVRCGLCMTGCPYGLIYSAAQTLDPLIRSNRVTHRSGLLVLTVAENGDRAVIVARSSRRGVSNDSKQIALIVVCGAMGTTRLVANSLGLFGVELSMFESQQFVLPMLSMRRTPDPRRQADFTLNQFNMIVALGGSSVDISQLHFYTFNSAFIDALPAPLRSPSGAKAQVELLRRLTVVLGYFPSWRSPRLRIRVHPTTSGACVPDVHVSADAAPPGRRQMLRSVLARLGSRHPRSTSIPSCRCCGSRRAGRVTTGAGASRIPIMRRPRSAATDSVGSGRGGVFTSLTRPSSRTCRR